jgi:hypothetical protein
MHLERTMVRTNYEMNQGAGEQDGELTRVQHSVSSAWIVANFVASYKPGGDSRLRGEFYRTLPASASKNKSGGWSEFHPPLSSGGDDCFAYWNKPMLNLRAHAT